MKIIEGDERGGNQDENDHGREKCSDTERNGHGNEEQTLNRSFENHREQTKEGRHGGEQDGAKAAFGVILITTKKGAETDGVNVSYSGNLSFQNISKEIEMGGIDAMEYTLHAFERVGATRAGAFWIVTREGYERAVEWQQNYSNVVGQHDPMLYGRDWYVDVNNFKIGLRMYDPYEYMIKEWTPTQLHNLSISGRSGKTNYNLGFGFLDQSGMNKPARKDDFQRYNGSVQIDRKSVV